MSTTPSFNGWHAAVLHRLDDGIERLGRQLERLGLAVTVQWAPLDLARINPDIVLVDADQGWDGLLPWQAGAAPMPLVALLGSEAPGRIAWAMEHGAGALIAKPVASSAVYPSLVMAVHMHAQRLAMAKRCADLEERMRLRPLVHGAVHAIMAARLVDESAAYSLLRCTAMRRRLTIEQIAAGIVAGQEPVPEAV
ncbi:ANTAR domain-containing response regulator [Labrys monachus]|uniref:AmiR/NasT family two-component response regulator n=1 Tax=Labrys monachus TaxID=217067 RepID=A0ABU0FIP3_9HYPH|nr:ANTAR domain-containing protein [Labrys monachus]MDQ0394474.1 AmiR/NasT family two-component response regulator [Labrys monachus]